MCPLSGVCSTEISEGLTALSGRHGPIHDAEPRSSCSLAGFASSTVWLLLPEHMVITVLAEYDVSGGRT